MNVDQRLIERIDALIKKGEGMTVTFPSGLVSGPGHHDKALFSEWRNQSLAFLINLAGADHTYPKEFEKEVTLPNPNHSKAGLGILRAFKQDLEGGYLITLKTLISAEVFSDFLEMAQHLLEQYYIHPAASLTGAVLEDGLRRFASSSGKVTVQSGDDLGSLNGKCSSAKIYNSIMSKQISLWTDIRNKADHGEFDQVKENEVADMLRGVRQFLADHLK